MKQLRWILVVTQRGSGQGVERRRFPSLDRAKRYAEKYIATRGGQNFAVRIFDGGHDDMLVFSVG